jgi:secreted Zn-dependent insulinase-like peptidase
LILFALTAAGCQSAGMPVGDGDTVVVHKSTNDDREYRYLVLPNRMKVLLASDPDADKAAASLVVFRGSYHEDPAYPGLAHFLEHMLFIGTQKYPEVDGYQQFIGGHGGTSNAYTAPDHTNYFFDIQPAYLDEALDRFAQFFISPLLAADYVDREKNAVNSEYQMQYKADSWRAAAAQKMVINPEHPASRFTIGSLETLGDGVRSALVEFFADNYSADQMALVVLGNTSLDHLESIVRPLFGQIDDHDIGPGTVTTPLFRPDALPATLRIVPLKEERTLSFDFPVPSLVPWYREQPDVYITNLLGHEGEGSLYAALKDAGFIESLSAASSRFDDLNAFVTIEIGLTESGASHIGEVTAALFAYIDLLKSARPDEWRYAEQATVADLAFRFQESPSPMRFVYGTAPDLGIYDPADVLRAPYMMEQFDPARIQELLGYLTPDNLLLTVTLPDAETDRTEPWFQVPYTIVQGPAPAASEHPGGLALPARKPCRPGRRGLVADEPAPTHKAD